MHCPLLGSPGARCPSRGPGWDPTPGGITLFDCRPRLRERCDNTAAMPRTAALILRLA